MSPPSPAARPPSPHPSDFLDPLSSPIDPPLRILFATEYLPPFVSGIANRCKNLVNGYRAEGHHVSVYSVAGTDCDVVVPSVPNPFYEHQRVFILPPLGLLWQLLNFSKPVPFDIVHIVAPLCLSFVFVLPFLKMRGVRIYVSYHVYLEYYKSHYVGDHPLLDLFLEILFTMIYYVPLVWLADCVGIPSKTADNYVYNYSRRIHYLKSGLDTSVFFPNKTLTTSAVPIEDTDTDDHADARSSLSRASSSASSLATKIIETPAGSDIVIHDIRRFAGTLPSRSSTTTNHANTNALDTDPTFHVNDGPVLIYVGRLAMEKNVEFLVQAMAHPRLANATLVIVGDGPMRQPLEDLARSIVGADGVYSPQTASQSLLPSAKTAPLAEHPFPSTDAPPSPALSATKTIDESLHINPSRRYRVIFTGMILNEHVVASYYGQCDIFVSASASETFGFTVAEAMACGTPAVVVRSGAFKTVYRTIDSWMFDEGDMDTYVSRLISVYNQGSRARIFARDLAVRGFSVHAAIRDLLRTYQWIIDGCPEGGSGKHITA